MGSALPRKPKAAVSPEKERELYAAIAKGGKPTLRSIASITGLAVTTVSRALLNAPQIAIETRQRVHKVARDIGYQPDRAAQRLKTGRTNVIAVLLDLHEEILGYGNSIMYGLTGSVQDTPYHLILMPNFRNSSNIEAVEYIVRNNLADGMVFAATEPFDARVRLLLENGFPFVCHGRTEFSTSHPWVDYDNYAFAYEATRRLITKGRRKVGVVLPPKRLNYSQHIRHGFMTAVREAGVAFEISEDIDLASPIDQIRDHVRRRAAAGDGPDGFVCPGEVLALATITGQSDAGQTLGVEYDIIAKQTSRLLTHIQPKVETIYEDLAEAGEKLGRIIMARIANPDGDNLQFLQAPQLGFQV